MWYHGEVSQLAGGFATFHGSFQTNHATKSSESWHLQLLKFEQVPFEMVLMIICQDAQVIRICMHSCKHVFVSVCVAGLHGNNISATNHPSFRDEKWSHVQASTSTTQALPAPISGELCHWSGGHVGQSMLTWSQVSHRPKLNKASKHPKFMEQQFFHFLVNQLAMNTCIWGQYVWETLHNFETPHLTLQQQIFSTKAQLFTSNKMRCPYIFGPLRGLQMWSAPVSPVALRPWSRRKVWRDQLPY